jgi:hypothetical protein
MGWISKAEFDAEVKAADEANAKAEIKTRSVKLLNSVSRDIQRMNAANTRPDQIGYSPSNAMTRPGFRW